MRIHDNMLLEFDEIELIGKPYINERNQTRMEIYAKAKNGKMYKINDVSFTQTYKDKLRLLVDLNQLHIDKGD